MPTSKPCTRLRIAPDEIVRSNVDALFSTQYQHSFMPAVEYIQYRQVSSFENTGPKMGGVRNSTGGGVHLQHGIIS